MDERQTVLQAQTGDKEAFSALYTLYKDRLYRYAFYRLGSSEAAEDAVSSCVLSAYEQIGKLRKAEAFSAWIFKILHHACDAELKAIIQRRKMAELNDPDGKTTVSFDNITERTELLQALGTLKDDERNIVLLSAVSGLSSKEIAKICDLTAGSVRSKLSRSLKKMRDFLGDTYEEK